MYAPGQENSQEFCEGASVGKKGLPERLRELEIIP